MFSRVLPPAGFPLSLPSVGSALFGGADAVPAFEQALASRLAALACIATSSGCAALALGLGALAEGSPRRVVVVPAYTCYTVPAAVVRAGLRVRLCDVDPETLDFDRSSLRAAVRDDVLAVVATGLYGLPADLGAVRAEASRHGAKVVDDAAQGFGAASDGAASGTLGDFGVLSFGRGKGLSTYQGGALVSSDEELIRTARRRLGSASPGRVGSKVFRAAGYAVFQRPRLYGMVRRIPGLKLGVSEFDPGFAIAPLGRFEAGLGLAALGIVDRVIEAQRERAARYADGLSTIAHLAVPRTRAGSAAVWLRFPVLAANRGLRDGLLAEASAAGLGVSASYPQPLTEIAGLAPSLAEPPAACPAAARVAETILTFPTHPAVSPDDQRKLLALAAGATTAPMRAREAT